MKLLTAIIRPEKRVDSVLRIRTGERDDDAL
jgi:nitrogen regulatory protein PII